MEITPEQLRQTRKRLGLTAKVAAASVHVAVGTWQGYEAPAAKKSFRPIPPGLLELFCIKHGLPFPPLRQDGSLIVGAAHVLSFVSATGGCGKTLITLELARMLALHGQRVAVITDSAGPWQQHPIEDNPKIFSESAVALTDHEVRDTQIRLRASGLLDDQNRIRVDGLQYFLHADEFRRLEEKSSTTVTLRKLTAEHDLILLDISAKTDAAVLLSDAIVYILDVSRAFATIAASTVYQRMLRNLDEGSTPKAACLLVNMEHPPYLAEIGGKTIQDIQMQLLATTLGKSHLFERAALSPPADHNSSRYSVRLLTDEAPESNAVAEYRTLANELLKWIGSDVQV